MIELRSEYSLVGRVIGLLFGKLYREEIFFLSPEQQLVRQFQLILYIFIH